MTQRSFFIFLFCLPLVFVAGACAPEGEASLFNGEDLSGWQVPEDRKIWNVVDGVIDCDAVTDATGEKSLWTEEEFGDFELTIDWRIMATPFIHPGVPLIKPDGSYKKNADGEDIHLQVPDSDSGIFLRGSSKSQINIWCWPIGSGEIYGYRTDPDMPPEVRAGATPKRAADRDIGEWNTFVITMAGDRVTVVLNDITVIEEAELPGIPSRGPIGLQHHGSRNAEGEWVSSPSIVQFRNIHLKEL